MSGTDEPAYRPPYGVPEWDDYTVEMPTSQLVTATIPPSDFVFMSESGEVGRLKMGPPMTFEGDAEESARVFFDYVLRFCQG